VNDFEEVRKNDLDGWGRAALDRIEAEVERLQEELLDEQRGRMDWELEAKSYVAEGERLRALVDGDIRNTLKSSGIVQERDALKAEVERLRAELALVREEYGEANGRLRREIEEWRSQLKCDCGRGNVEPWQHADECAAFMVTNGPRPFSETSGWPKAEVVSRDIARAALAEEVTPIQTDP